MNKKSQAYIHLINLKQKEKIDITKDFLELPRFPINEKYGELKRFKSIIKT